MRIFRIIDIRKKIKYPDNIYKKYTINLFKKEFSLIKWYPWAQTKIHNHMGRKCSFFLINGPLHESIYSKKFDDYYIPTSHKIHNKFTLGYIDDSIGFHSMKNPNNKSKYSIHYYR